MRAVLLIVGASLIAVGLYLIAFGDTPGDAPKETPRIPAASIGPDGAEPAWTHVCPGTDDEPAGCKDI
ncbi:MULTISPECIES: hypothetical protein [unclassified Streptomyces]|uniref:hypothetical protein n=1 Tax=unclassified Streptomyces TaxID=2593676 RepID=UPI002E27BA7D|nr:hypothetical protein [Streptomyces sp. NBC_00285]